MCMKANRGAVGGGGGAAAWEAKVTITWSPKRGFFGNLFFLSMKCRLFIPLSTF